MDKPIIFSATMVRALLDGRKTQTRRLLTPQPSPPHFAHFKDGRVEYTVGPDGKGKMVPYIIGDRLWVREAFNSFQFSQDGDEAWPVDVPTLQECREAEELAHRFGAPQIVFRESDRARKWFSDQKWRSPIHMPRWASRITLVVTDVRVQRLQEISSEDAEAEGTSHCEICNDVGWLNNNPDGGEECVCCGGQSYEDDFRDVWNSIHGDGAWAANPWVCALTFTVHKQNIDQMGRGDG